MQTISNSTTQTDREPQDPREYARLLSRQKMFDRARRLWADGYTIYARTWTSNAYVTRPVRGQFTVISPAGMTYDVDLVAQTCTCVCWRRQATCKHILGAVGLAEAQGYDLTRRSTIGKQAYAEGRLLLAAVADCRAVLVILAGRAADERREGRAA